MSAIGHAAGSVGSRAAIQKSVAAFFSSLPQELKIPVFGYFRADSPTVDLAVLDRSLSEESPTSPYIRFPDVALMLSVHDLSGDMSLNDLAHKLGVIELVFQHRGFTELAPLADSLKLVRGELGAAQTDRIETELGNAKRLWSDGSAAATTELPPIGRAPARIASPGVASALRQAFRNGDRTVPASLINTALSMTRLDLSKGSALSKKISAAWEKPTDQNIDAAISLLRLVPRRTINEAFAKVINSRIDELARPSNGPASYSHCYNYWLFSTFLGIPGVSPEKLGNLGVYTMSAFENILQALGHVASLNGRRDETEETSLVDALKYAVEKRNVPDQFIYQKLFRSLAVRFFEFAPDNEEAQLLLTPVLLTVSQRFPETEEYHDPTRRQADKKKHLLGYGARASTLSPHADVRKLAAKIISSNSLKKRMKKGIQYAIPAGIILLFCFWTAMISSLTPGRAAIDTAWEHVAHDYSLRDAAVADFLTIIRRQGGFDRETISALSKAREHLASLPPGEYILGDAARFQSYQSAQDDVGKALADIYYSASQQTTPVKGDIQQLLDDLQTAENALNNSRPAFEENVQAYNRRIEIIPSFLIGSTAYKPFQLTLYPDI